MMDRIYLKKETRDDEVRKLKLLGCQVRKYSMRNQLLHPMYVIDFGKDLTPEERGFGNTLYKTLFAVLYGLEVIK